MAKERAAVRAEAVLWGEITISVVDEEIATCGCGRSATTRPRTPLGSNQNGPAVSFARGGFVLIHMGLPQALGFLTRMDPVSMVRAALGRRKYRDLA